MASVTGGDKLQAHLKALAGNLASAGSAPSVSIGFLEGGSYPNGGPSIALVAAVNEFGGHIEREPNDPDEGKGQIIYRSLSKRYLKELASGVVERGAFFDKYGATGYLKQGRFVKAGKANLETKHYVGAYVINIPPRPYFRNMIKANAPTWGAAMAKLLVATKFNATRTLRVMGELIEGQLKQSILDLRDPTLAPSTIAKKSRGKVSALAKAIGGPAKPLIDTRIMFNSVHYQVNKGA
jgi:hypothetical protein